MRKSRIATLAVAAAAATMAVTVVTAPTASAAMAPPRSPVDVCRMDRNLFCVWWDINFGGSSLSASVNSSFTGWGYYTDLRQFGWNDAISSVSNNTNYGLTLFQDINMGGMTLTIQGPMQLADLTRQVNGGTTWNDLASSIKVYNKPW
ncbi:MAG: peptidase inhibitor family I36 protein [Propionibacteriaceae bacterium]|nr:peptidase inhibitor family I36 protein [Propionibacteriaceae bacterium]